MRTEVSTLSSSASSSTDITRPSVSDAPLRPGGTAQLGSREVARIGFGAMQLPRCAPDRDAAIAVVRRAVELGVDHVDTAKFYGHGFSNSILAEALRGENRVVVVSKVGADPDEGGPFPLRVAQRPEQLRASVEDNLRALGREQIDVVNLRRMDRDQRIPMSPEQHVDLDDQLAEMVAMREEGLIGGIGISNVTADGLRRALGAGIVCVQNEYSLVNRADEDMHALAAREGIAWVPFFPLGGAFPGSDKVSDLPAVQDVAAALGSTPAQVGLAWLLRHAPSTLLIPGTANIDHLEQNLAVGDIALDEETLAALDSAVVPSAPSDAAPADTDR